MVEEYRRNVRLAGLGYIIYGIAYNDGVLACGIFDARDDCRAGRTERRQVLGVEDVPDASAVEFAELCFALVACPGVFRRSLLDNLHDVILPRLIAFLDSLVEAAPAGALVVDGDASFEPSESLEQGFFQGEAALFTESAVQFGRTFRRGSTVDVEFQVLCRYVSVSCVNVFYKLVNLPFVVGEVGIEAAYTDSIVYFERVAGFSGVSL